MNENLQYFCENLKTRESWGKSWKLLKTEKDTRWGKSSLENFLFIGKVYLCLFEQKKILMIFLIFICCSFWHYCKCFMVNFWSIWIKEWSLWALWVLWVKGTCWCIIPILDNKCVDYIYRILHRLQVFKTFVKVFG